MGENTGLGSLPEERRCVFESKGEEGWSWLSFGLFPDRIEWATGDLGKWNVEWIKRRGRLERQQKAKETKNHQQLHLPGEITDPRMLHRMSRLNGALLFLSSEFFGGIEPRYTSLIPLELDQTEAPSLPAKLDEIRRRELARFGFFFLD
ncbi:unnamed protein product [Lupinus luteus]|uniref:Uncharacterized protein n=1 Tax=Lupinus luteus TaxID=3873 RepID=A0AAV1WJ61_LUPLU